MTRARGPILAAALLLLAAGCGRRDADGGAAASGQVAPVPTGGLIDRVVVTPEGGYRMGNPAARVALVEFGSYTCPHCAKFAVDATPDIRRLVAAGTLSFELRPFARDIVDLTAGLVATCAGPAGFFATSDRIFAAQQEWIGNAQTITPGDQAKIDALPPPQQFRALARATGLNAYAGRAGAPDGCLTDPKAIARVVATHDRAYRDWHIVSTPTFLLNGRPVPAADWRTLKPLVDAAAG